MNNELPSPPAALRLSAQWETVNQLACISKLVQSAMFTKEGQTTSPGESISTAITVLVGFLGCSRLQTRSPSYKCTSTKQKTHSKCLLYEENWEYQCVSLTDLFMNLCKGLCVPCMQTQRRNCFLTLLVSQVRATMRGHPPTSPQRKSLLLLS